MLGLEKPRSNAWVIWMSYLDQDDALFVLSPNLPVLPKPSKVEVVFPNRYMMGMRR